MRDVEIRLEGDVPAREVWSVLRAAGAYSLDDVVPGSITLERPEGKLFIVLNPGAALAPRFKVGELPERVFVLRVIIHIGSGSNSDGMVFDVANRLLTLWPGVVVGVVRRWTLPEMLAYWEEHGSYPWVDEADVLAREARMATKRKRKGPFRP